MYVRQNVQQRQLPVPIDVGRVKFDPIKALWLWTMILITVVFAIDAVTPTLAAVAGSLTFLTLCIGHSVGLHRGVIHQTYRAHPAVIGAMMYLSVMTGLGGPLTWARFHAVRDYWQNHANCPPYFSYRFGIARDFFWNLHCSFAPADDRALARLPPGIMTNRWLRFLEATWPLHILAFACVVLVIAGPNAVAVLICARTAIATVGHWFIGYAAHVWGEQRYRLDAPESGTNVWILGVIAFGEGYHNNHHAFPNSAKFGQRWYELDIGYLVLRIFAALGIVRGLQCTQPIVMKKCK
jgi:fatty-acid desaturase